jgi:excisionase family DNA binding protein
MERLAISIEEAARLGGPRRAKLYDEIARGKLRAIKVGRATRILITDFQNYMAGLPAIEPKATAQPEPYGRLHGQRRRRSK